jgi:hypothetical protein
MERLVHLNGVKRVLRSTSRPLAYAGVFVN